MTIELSTQPQPRDVSGFGTLRTEDRWVRAIGLFVIGDLKDVPNIKKYCSRNYVICVYIIWKYYITSPSETTSHNCRVWLGIVQKAWRGLKPFDSRNIFFLEKLAQDIICWVNCFDGLMSPEASLGEFRGIGSSWYVYTPLGKININQERFVTGIFSFEFSN